MRRGVRLGVDVGEARVGLAASDVDGVLAIPVATLARDHEHESDLSEIARQVIERAVLEVVVGLPRGLDGREGLAAARARDYAAALSRHLSGVSVRLVDERLTTVDAHRALHASGVAGRRHRDSVDQQAAVLILQSALEQERSTGEPAGTVVGGRRPRARRARVGGEGRQP